MWSFTSIIVIFNWLHVVKMWFPVCPVLACIKTTTISHAADIYRLWCKYTLSYTHTSTQLYNLCRCCKARRDCCIISGDVHTTSVSWSQGGRAREDQEGRHCDYTRNNREGKTQEGTGIGENAVLPGNSKLYFPECNTSSRGSQQSWQGELSY